LHVNGERSLQLMKISYILGCVLKSKETKAWIVLQMEVIFWSYWRKRLCIQWFWTFIKKNSSKSNGTNFIFLIDHVWWLVFFTYHKFLWYFFLKIFVGWKRRTWREWKFIGFNGYIIVILHEYNLCSNSKWKIVPSPLSTNEKVDKLPNLQWIVIWHETW
jgi:hypothetical protein